MNRLEPPLLPVKDRYYAMTPPETWTTQDMKDVEESSASAEEENGIKSDDEGEHGRQPQMRDELSMDIEVVGSGIPDATNTQDRKLCEVPRRLSGME